MPNITINQQEYDYSEREVIIFEEGIIGLPHMRRAVLIPLSDYPPFCWLASLDDEKNRFIVVNPNQIFADYKPASGADAKKISEAEVWAIVKISSDWRKTTVNLRAPLFINRETKSGVQLILTETEYGLAETLPGN
jgi:flagellar assembly factor FliW